MKSSITSGFKPDGLGNQKRTRQYCYLSPSLSSYLFILLTRYCGLGSDQTGTGQASRVYCDRMSGAQHRLNRHMGAVSAGLEVVEVMGLPPRRTQEQIWADETRSESHDDVPGLGADRQDDSAEPVAGADGVASAAGPG